MMSEDEWVSDSDLEALKMDRTLLTGQSSVQQAWTILSENSPTAALTIAKLARHAENEHVRLRAAVYILEKTLPTASDGEAKGPVEGLFDKVISDVEDYLQSQVAGGSPEGEPPS